MDTIPNFIEFDATTALGSGSVELNIWSVSHLGLKWSICSFSLSAFNQWVSFVLCLSQLASSNFSLYMIDLRFFSYRFLRYFRAISSQSYESTKEDVWNYRKHFCLHAFCSFPETHALLQASNGLRNSNKETLVRANRWKTQFFVLLIDSFVTRSLESLRRTHNFSIIIPNVLPLSIYIKRIYESILILFVMLSLKLYSEAFFENENM